MYFIPRMTAKMMIVIANALIILSAKGLLACSSASRRFTTALAVCCSVSYKL